MSADFVGGERISNTLLDTVLLNNVPQANCYPPVFSCTSDYKCNRFTGVYVFVTSKQGIGGITKRKFSEYIWLSLHLTGIIKFSRFDLSGD
jgi:hypothetical protein